MRENTAERGTGRGSSFPNTIGCGPHRGSSICTSPSIGAMPISPRTGSAIPIVSASPRTNRSDGCSINCTGHKKITFDKREDMPKRLVVWALISNLRMGVMFQWIWKATGRDGPYRPRVPLQVNGTRSGRTAGQNQSKKWKTNEYKNNFYLHLEPVPILLFGQYWAENDQYQFGISPFGRGNGF